MRNALLEKSIVLDRVHDQLLGLRRAELTEIIGQHARWTVQNGPFRGMGILPKSCWGDGDLVTKLLGTYEEELHLAIEHFRKKSYGAVINVGCAEGYYAVGLSLLLPDVPVFAFDISTKAQELCCANAQLNGRVGQIQVAGKCGSLDLKQIVDAKRRCLLVIDCEGNELELLDFGVFGTSLVESDLIIECHDFARAGITQELIGRFSKTHVVVNCGAGARNPNAISMLTKLGDHDRWLLMSESRPCSMNWLICEARQ